MRLTIGLINESKKNPPYDHNYLLASAFLSVLREHDSGLSTILHDMKSTSPYVLSEIFPRRDWDWTGYFCVGSSNSKLIKLISEALVPQTKIRVSDVEYSVSDIKVEPTPTDLPSPLELRTLSPVLVRESNNHSRCAIPTDACYLETLNRLLKSKIDGYVGKSHSCSVLRVIPDCVRKRHISNGIVLATKGTYFVEGSSDAISFLLDHGMGSNTSMGFGFVVPSGRW